jgi:phage-related protein
MFGSIFLKDEASDKLDDIDRKGKKTSSSLSGLGKIALKAGAGIAAFASASAGAVATSAPLLAGVGGLVASFGAAGIGAIGFGAVAMGALAPVIEGAENLTKAQQGAREELEAFQSFWTGFVKQFETPVFEIFGQALTMIRSVLTGLAPTITNVANVISEMFTGMNESINNGGLKPFFEWMENNAARSLENFATITGNVFSGFFGLMQAFTPIGISMETGLVNLTTRFREWANALTENPAFQNFIDYVNTNAPVLLSIIGNVITVFGGLIGVLAPVGTLVLGFVDSITTLLASLVQGNITIQQFGTGVQTTITNLISSILPKIMELMPTIIQGGIQIILGLLNGIVQALPQILAAAFQIIAMLIQGLTSAIPQLLSTAMNLITIVANALIANLPMILNAGIQLLLRLVMGIVQMLPQLVSTALRLITSLVNTLVSNLPQIINAGVKILKSLIDGIVKILPSLLTTAVKLVTTIAGALLDNLPLIMSAGVEILTSLIKGIGSAVGQLISTAAKIGVDLGNKFDEIDLTEVGVNIIKGMINGVKSMAGALVDAASSVVGGAIQGAKNLLGIKSPSRVFMEIGEFTGQGMEIGLDKSKQGVESASKELAVVAARSASETKTTSGGSSDSSLLASVKTMLENFKVDLFMDSTLVGAGVAPSVSVRQGEQISRTRFFSGGDKR